MQEQQNPEELLSANEAGKLLGISGKTVIRLMEEGKYAGYKIGSYWKFKRGDIIQYRESRKYERGKSEPVDDVA